MGTDLIPAQFTVSSVVVWAIDLLKRAKWFPWLSVETESLNRFAACIGAAITSAGIHFALEPAAEGQWTMHITGLSIWSITHFGKGFLVAIVTQQTVLKAYQMINLL